MSPRRTLGFLSAQSASAGAAAAPASVAAAPVVAAVVVAADAALAAAAVADDVGAVSVSASAASEVGAALAAARHAAAVAAQAPPAPVTLTSSVASLTLGQLPSCHPCHCFPWLLLLGPSAVIFLLQAAVLALCSFCPCLPPPAAEPHVLVPLPPPALPAFFSFYLCALHLPLCPSPAAEPDVLVVLLPPAFQIPLSLAPHQRTPVFVPRPPR
eukprot:CAMPEP_0202339522 /NCGR_PEP_ID=MMETSP1126-20121109/1345_1 /ASSEMBLY_ACC=CAM_ASM_000457 /TAXON_ID=3047 /ORGANISM="Dunaliella tertiolecta, Strain CCMP1320" /LENGTH=212 /DNA_ID=CAMNT_0048930079 /DNA_START=421 /DNA_END=1057 /DNA_ORIENTATION=-